MGGGGKRDGDVGKLTDPHLVVTQEDIVQNALPRERARINQGLRDEPPKCICRETEITLLFPPTLNPYTD